MKWTYSLKNKILASAVLLVLCLLVLLSNYLDRIHTRHVKNSILTLYEDRVMAEDYILKMTGTIYQIREIINSGDSQFLQSEAIKQLLGDFKIVYTAFLKTKLTPTEKAAAIELNSHVLNFEKNYFESPFETTGKALLSLNKLSAVQVAESGIIMKSTESEYAAIKASSQFAFTIIIIILAVLQAIVFSAKNLPSASVTEDPSLN